MFMGLCDFACEVMNVALGFDDDDVVLSKKKRFPVTVNE
jgi:hypothetical protein